jgi:hypothetical protein
MSQNKEKKKAQILQRKMAWQSRKVMEKFPLNLIQVETRSKVCGECRVCCTAVAVDSVEKPVWTACRHECDSGCGIYDTRPDECRTYECLYQSGVLKFEEHRPDKLGVMFDIREIEETKKSAIIAWEVVPGALEKPEVKKLLRDIASTSKVGIRRHGMGAGLVEAYRNRE